VRRAAKRPSSEHKRGSGEQGYPPEPRYLAVGLVVGAHGLHGELKVQLLTDDPRRFGQLERVFLGMEDTEPTPWHLVSYRLHKGRALLQIEGCSDRAEAQALRGCLIQVPIDEAIPLEEGQYFEHQIIGLEVWTVASDHLGRIDEIIHTGSNEVYVVHGAGPDLNEILIPAIAGVVLEIDLAAGRLVVELPEGLI